MLTLKFKTNKMGRLKKRSDFLYVQKQGKKWIAKSMIVEVADNQLESLRYGITVSKKISKKAVERNRLKRRLRAVACDILSDYSYQAKDIVIVGRQFMSEDGDEVAYDVLKNDLRWCLKKMSIMPD